MKIRRINSVAVLGFVFTTSLCGMLAAQDQAGSDRQIAWFDMDHCEICKNFASMKHSMHKIKWENHLLNNGMISISIVPDGMKKDMAKAQTNIQTTVARLERGERLDMCGHCHLMGKLMGMGADFKQIQSLGVDVSIVTSAAPEVVQEIHAFAKQSIMEHEKMLKKVQAETDN